MAFADMCGGGGIYSPGPLNGGVSDIDGSSVVKGMVIIGADQRIGEWQWSNNGGLTWWGGAG